MTIYLISIICAVLNYPLSKAPFITIDKMCAVLKGVKCAVTNGKCAIFNDAQSQYYECLIDLFSIWFSYTLSVYADASIDR